LCRIWTRNEGCLTERHYWSIENPFCPGQFMSIVSSCICLYRRFILASTHCFFPFLNLEIHLSLHSWNEFLVCVHFLLSSIVHLKCHLRFKGSFLSISSYSELGSDWKVQDRLLTARFYGSSICN
jgi:hypothetical protein